MSIVQRPDAIDKMVFFETLSVRKKYYQACANLNIEPRKLSPIVIMQRSVVE